MLRFCFYTCLLFLTMAASYQNLFAAPGTLKYGLSIYDDYVGPVIGHSRNQVIGNVEGFSGVIYYRKSFYDDQFYFRTGFLFDWAPEKKIIDRNIRYTLTQERYELPAIIGVSMWNVRSRIYFGAGLSYVIHYELNIDTSVQAAGESGGLEETYTLEEAVGYHSVIGIMIKLKGRRDFFLEFLNMSAPRKGTYKATNARTDVFMNPNFQRVYFGINQRF